MEARADTRAGDLLERERELAALDRLIDDAEDTELARADVLRADPPLGFVHPLVLDAVYGDISPAERELARARAAEVLGAAHAPEEEVAAQLVRAPRRGALTTVQLRGRRRPRRAAAAAPTARWRTWHGPSRSRRRRISAASSSSSSASPNRT